MLLLIPIINYSELITLLNYKINRVITIYSIILFYNN